MINTKQLCEILKISDKTAYNWRENEGLPYIRVGPKKIQYNEDDVMEWVKTHNIEARLKVDIEDLEHNQTGKIIDKQFENFEKKTTEEQLNLYNLVIKYATKNMTYEGTKLDEVVKAVQMTRSISIASICSEYRFYALRERHKFNWLEVPREQLEDELDSVLARQQRFSEKLTTLILKNIGDNLESLPTDEDIQELYDIAKK